MRAFKFVDLEHADSVASGQLLIGSLSSYRRLESTRRDELEGTVRPTFSGRPDPTDSELHKRLSNIGIEITPGSIGHLVVDSPRIRVPDVYCFCMSKFDFARPAGEHAAFEVLAARELLKLLTQTELGRLGAQAQAGTVSYQERVGSLSQLALRPSAFIKEKRFTSECEFRFIWSAPGLNASQAQAGIHLPPTRSPADLEPFLTRPDHRVAALLRRLY